MEQPPDDPDAWSDEQWIEWLHATENDAETDARVFADGYYVGIVNDFDGIFQHMNLEAGPHHLEIRWGNSEPIAFDVYVRPGETTTFRGDGYFAGY